MEVNFLASTVKQISMLSPKEIITILKTAPTGYKLPKDAFFSESNMQLLPYYKKLGVIGSAKEDEDMDKGTVLEEIYCNVPGCKQMCEGVSAYQTHYNGMHRYVCAECRRALPTAHLLDLHLSEKHDSYFAARVARGDVVYACYLQECTQLMSTPKERKEHCVKVHKLPVNFRFGQLDGKLKATVENKSEAKQTDSMDIDNNSVNKLHSKTFSFGHQKEKMFPAKSGKNKTLDLQDLKNALPDIS